MESYSESRNYFICYFCMSSTMVNWTSSSVHGQRKVKRSLMSWVVVIPKEGRALVATPTLLLVWHRLLKKNLKFKNKNSKKSVSYQKSARPSFFWYDNDSGHKGPFWEMQPNWTSSSVRYDYRRRREVLTIAIENFVWKSINFWQRQDIFKY